MSADKENTLSDEQDRTSMGFTDPWVSARRVADLFGVKTYTIRDWIKSGVVSATKINGRWYVRQSEVSRLANNRYGSN